MTLAKYKKKQRDLDTKKAEEDAAHRKRQQKEERRLMGRLMPTKAEADYERDLQIIATKGVVQLFNAVSEYQGQVAKEINKEERDKKQSRKDVILSAGADKNTGAVGFGNLIDKIQAKTKKWQVLEDEEGSDGGLKLDQFDWAPSWLWSSQQANSSDGESLRDKLINS